MSIKTQRGFIKKDIFRKSFGLLKKKNLGNILLREILEGCFQKMDTDMSWTIVDIQRTMRV